MDSSPYRSDGLSAVERRAPVEFVYRSAEAMASPWRAAFGLLLIFGIGGLITGALGRRPGTGLAIGLVLAMVVIFRFRRAGDAAEVVIRVADGSLTLTRGARGTPFAQATLENLLDVTIETVDITAAFPSFEQPNFGRAEGTRDDSPQESRVAFVLRGRDAPVYLSSERQSVVQTREWLGQIRSFLREGEWLPIDERGEDAQVE